MLGLSLPVFFDRLMGEFPDNFIFLGRQFKNSMTSLFVCVVLKYVYVFVYQQAQMTGSVELCK